MENFSAMSDFNPAHHDLADRLAAAAHIEIKNTSRRAIESMNRSIGQISRNTERRFAIARDFKRTSTQRKNT
jgi:hypothetical protein